MTGKPVTRRFEMGGRMQVATTPRQCMLCEVGVGEAHEAVQQMLCVYVRACVRACVRV